MKMESTKAEFLTVGGGACKAYMPSNLPRVWLNRELWIEWIFGGGRRDLTEFVYAQ